MPAFYPKQDKPEIIAQPRGSHEEEIAPMNGGSVAQRDNLVVPVESGMDLPLRGVELRERRALCGGAEASEPDRVACCRAIASEVGDDVAVCLPGREFEKVETTAACERVGPTEAVEDVGTSVTDKAIGMTGA